MSGYTEKIDKTIISVCVWIQNEIEGGSENRSEDSLTDMVKALAELIAARVSIKD